VEEDGDVIIGVRARVSARARAEQSHAFEARPKYLAERGAKAQENRIASVRHVRILP
jgi:hypothetical protein